jgi:hypothetical protein
MMSPPEDLETDPRFPSGPWTGFWLQSLLPGRHMMELRLTFRNGELTGTGRDRVGEFTFQGRYIVQDGTCRWNKHYIGKHDVDYKGYNEGKGIWGVWEMVQELAPAANRGGFHIWPEGMADPSQPALSEEADMPLDVHVDELVAAPE